MTISQDVLDRNPEYAKELRKQSGRVKPKSDRSAGYDSELESQYAQYLALICGADRPWHYHGLTFRLADGKTYTPDFDFEDASGVTVIIETKGSRQQKNARDSYTRWCVAAGMYPQFRWWWVEKVDGSIAVIEERFNGR